jgi:N-acetylmuramoyl-L-alanine amidase
MTRRIVASVFLLGFLAFCISSFTKKEGLLVQKQKLRKIVIDAGHGGSDYGASGKYSHEKEVSLAVALKLQKEIEEQMPDVEVYMTRTTDVYDRVTEKANKANAAKGDLFVSIHCNSAGSIRHSEFIGYKTEKYKRKKKTYTRQVKQYRTYYSPNPAKGTETFIWGIGKNDDKEKALQDHEELYMDSVTAKELKDFDPNDPEKMILYSIKTKQFFDRSARLALTVEDEFKKTGRPSRQAQQRGKGIWVLQAVAMPAVLIEIGFISNPEEEDYLNSEIGQQEIVTAIANAIKRYKYTLETTGIKQGSMAHVQKGN